MNAPDPPDPLPDDLAALLTAERTRPPPVDAARARVRARVARTIGGAASGGPSPAPPASSAPAALPRAGRSWRAAALARYGLVALLGGLAGAAVGARWGRSDRSVEVRTVTVERVVYRDRAVTAPAASVPLPPPPVADAAPSRPASAPPAAAAGASAPDPNAGATRAELARIETARSALLRGDAAAAIAALRAHAARFPRGQFAEEREALWVQASAEAGDAAGARARAARFHAAYPGSMLGPAVDRALRSIP